MDFGSIRLAVSALSSAILLTACAPVVLMNATIEQDKLAKTFLPPEDKSLIYVFLDEPNVKISKHVVVDGRVAGLVRPSFYVVSKVPPGRHQVGVGHAEADSISLDTEQGKTYFINARTSCEGGHSHAQLQLVDESIGKERVSVSNLANITLFGVPLLNDRPVNPCEALADNA